MSVSRLSDKLKSLGVHLGARDLVPARRRDVYAVERIVEGRFEETTYGKAFVAESWYPRELQHGEQALGLQVPLHTVAQWADEPRLTTSALEAFVFLDTETTGLAGGTGTYAFMVGVGRYEDDSFHLAQFFMRNPNEEPALLAALSTFLEPCQALVTFNGKGFDVPLLNARYVATRFAADYQASPLTPRAHLDLLQLARVLWRDRLPSRALGSLEEHILGVVRSQQDVPGWLIPQIYFDYLRSGDARPLKSVFYHNAIDVLSMAALLNHIATLLDEPLNCPSILGLDLVGIGKLFEGMGQVETAVRLYERALAHDLPEDVYRRILERVSCIQKRGANLTAAVALWQVAALRGEVYAYVELAKFHEHKQRNNEEAARWTQAAIDLVRAAGYPRSQRQQWLPELQHRMARLRRKLGDSGDMSPTSGTGPDAPEVKNSIRSDRRTGSRRS